VFGGGNSELDLEDIEFTHLRVNKYVGSKLNIVGSGTVVVRGGLSVESGTPMWGSFTAYGDVRYGALTGTGNASLYLTGGKNQEIAFEVPERFRGNIDIKKDGGGVVILASPVNLGVKGQSIRVREGTLDLNGNNIEYVRKAKLRLEKGAVLILRGGEIHPAPVIKKGSTVHYRLERGLGLLDNVEYDDLILDSARGLKFYPSDKGLTVNGDLTLAGGILDLNKNQTVKVGGSWLKKKGKLLPGNGTVVFTGEINVIEGDNTFYNIRKETVEGKTGMLIVEAGSSQRVNGEITLKGNGCNFLHVRSARADEPWKLTVLGETNFASLYVQGLKFDRATEAECKDECIDGGGNAKIVIESQKCRRP